ncbi:MAG TPA: hypothetical protein PK087_00195 [Bacilli bacterium]|nr:MAG: hypothetical protein BWY97_01414 [Tenericutes bacterium ADurb.BinA124]HNZ50060.1 hypothetical protein [Bacilli bacterium]HOH17718.1 hypothetical protein [Bacilli bacterium]HPN60571.1 hypothetical protein [Bacilli bacterium]HPX84811.1 hypothetical protein [Bacilli bacterium]
MDFVKELFEKGDAKVGPILDPIVTKITEFLSNTGDTALALILLFTGILILVGLFAWLRRTPRFFLFVLILFGIVVGAWFLFGK